MVQHTLRRAASSRRLTALLLTGILVVSGLIGWQVHSNAAISNGAQNSLGIALTNQGYATEIADAIDANTEIRAATVLTAEHGAGAIGTYVAPATTRRTINGTLITDIKIDLTGLDSSGTENDVIGLSTGGAAYVGRNVVATNGNIYKIEVICIEVPLGGDADILFVAGSAADEAFDDTVANTATLADGSGDWVAGQIVTLDNPALTTNYYYYMTQGATDNAIYTAGQYIMRFYSQAAL